MCLSTYRIKLLVVVITLVLMVDGLLKLSTSATLMLYYHDTQYCIYLIERILLGFLITIMVFFGFLMLFYDSFCGVLTYSTVIFLISVCDIITVFYRHKLDASSKPKVLEDYQGRNLKPTMRREVAVLEDGIGDNLLIISVVIQLCVSITGWFLAYRLHRYNVNERNYERDKESLNILRKK